MGKLNRIFLVAACAAIITPASAYPRGNTIRVKSPASIQAALDAASGGDKIIVETGTYAEQISITKNGITLIGKDVIIVPPTEPVTNACTNLAGEGKQAGICIAGSDIVYVDQPFDGQHKKVQSVGTYVKDAKVSGFTVQGFSGLNIAVLGAKNADVTYNTVSAGPQYGMLTVGSKDTDIKHNTVLPGGFIGICMDDTSSVEIANNEISGYYIGLCVQTAKADIHDNTVHDSCIGAYVDPNISGARLHENTFRDTATWCDKTYGLAGVIISGAKNTVLRSNTFTNIGLDQSGAAVVVQDDEATGAVATGNNIQKNTFSANNLDIYAPSKGKGNVIKKNTCTTSFPAGLCPVSEGNNGN
jgi:hypothetical protein